MGPEEQTAIDERGRDADDDAGDGGGGPDVAVRREEIVNYGEEAEGRRGKCRAVAVLVQTPCWSMEAGSAQKDLLGLEQLVAADKGEQRGERVAGREQRGDKDGQDRLGEPELGILCVEAWEQQISGRGALTLAFACVLLLMRPRTLPRSSTRRQRQPGANTRAWPRAAGAGSRQC